MSRRHILAALGGSALTLAGSAGLAHAAGRRRIEKPGVILGSVNKAMKDNPRATLETLAGLGFRELEFDGPAAAAIADRTEFKKMIADLGFTPVAGGASMYGINTDLPKLIESAHFFGRKYVVCYWPWADKGLNKGPDDWRKLGDTLNGLGTTLAKEGLSLAYHNHDIEFVWGDGQLPYELVLSHTDPKLVSMEMDIYWVHKGGQDAAALVKRHPGRFSLFHVKDMERGEARGTECVGLGQMDFRAVLAELARQGGEHHFMWEREGNHDAATQMACARQSAKSLAALRF